MSLVGTRPPTVDEYEQYELGHRKRHKVSGSACEKVGDSAAVLTVVGDGNGQAWKKAFSS